MVSQVNLGGQRVPQHTIPFVHRESHRVDFLLCLKYRIGIVVFSMVGRGDFFFSFSIHVSLPKMLYNCDYPSCLFVGTRASYVKAHKRSHIGLKVYCCALCPALFCTKRNLKLHHLAAHTNEMAYTCKLCSYKASSSVELQLHSLRQ